MKKLSLLILSLCSVSLSYAADASATSTPYYSSGYYLGLNLGKAYAIYIGYNVNHYFALDMGYLWLPTMKIETTQGETKSSNNGFDVNVKVKYPIGEGFAFYATGGAAILRLAATVPHPKVTQNATTMTYGAGLDYVFANVGGLHTTLDYQRVNKKTGENIESPDYDLYSLGVYYQF